MSTSLESIDVAALLTRRMLGFQAFLRGQGFQIGIPEVVDAFTLAQSVDIINRRRLRASLRSLLCGGHGDWARFEDLFDAYWLPPNRTVLSEASGSGADAEPANDINRERPPRLLDDVRKGAGDAHNIAGDNAAQGGASGEESLQTRDFRFLSRGDELEAVERLVDRLATRMRRRMIRRQQMAKSGRRVDLRRTIRNSLQYGG